MSRAISNDLNSPVSLLWAYQLRREHATLVSEIKVLKDLHPSASELKEMMAKTQKAEVNTAKACKELVELRAAHQKTIKTVETLRKEVKLMKDAEARSTAYTATWRRKREQLGQNLRLEVKDLQDTAKLRGEKLTNVEDQIRDVYTRMAQGRLAMEEHSKQRAGRILDMEGLLRERNQNMHRRAGPSQAVSEPEPFDLDAGMPTAVAMCSRSPSPDSTLAPIRRPSIAQASSPRKESQKQKATAGLPTERPALPPAAGESTDHFSSPLAQGKVTLAAYIQIADSQYKEAPPQAEQDFVQSFVRGLRDKRDRNKCGKKIENGENLGTWEALKRCFPVASQSCCQMKPSPARHEAQFRETQIPASREGVPEREERDGLPERMEARRILQSREAAANRSKTLPGVELECIADAPSTKPAVGEHQQRHEKETEKKNRGQHELLHQRSDKKTLIPEKRSLAEADDGSVPPACRMDVKVATSNLELGEKKRKKQERRQRNPQMWRQERIPSIPILASSEDDFAR